MRGVFVRIEQPVDFDSVDDQPVDLFFALFAPSTPAPSTCGRWPASRACCARRACANSCARPARADAVHALLVQEASARPSAA
jgi:PTS system nitrogen regulatory IIA component